MPDIKISQLSQLSAVSGNEDILVALNNQNYRLKSSDLMEGLAAQQVDKVALQLDQVDNTSDLNKPISTATQAALDEKASTVDLANKADVAHQHIIADVQDLQQTLDSKVDLATLDTKADTAHLHAIIDVDGLSDALTAKADVAALDSKASITDLANKADVAHQHVIADVQDLQQALDSKVESSALAAKADVAHQHAIADVDGLSTALTDLQVSVGSKANTLDLAAKADAVHTHQYQDISNLQDLIALIKAGMQPELGISIDGITADAANINVDFVTSNGYDMDGIVVKTKYKLSADSTWTDLPDFAFNNGQLNYDLALSILVATSEYDVEVNVIDTNNPNWSKVFTETFTTI